MAYTYTPTYTPQYQFPAAPSNVSSPDGRRWVQGEIGALSYYITDNNVVTLWDSTDQDVFYEKYTDPTGKPVLKKYRKTEIPLSSAGGKEESKPSKEHDELRKEYEALKKRVARLERRRRNDEYDGLDPEDQ